MDANPPTMADYAWAAASDAKDLMKKFESRIVALENRVKTLEAEAGRNRDPR